MARENEPECGKEWCQPENPMHVVAPFVEPYENVPALSKLPSKVLVGRSTSDFRRGAMETWACVTETAGMYRPLRGSSAVRNIGSSYAKRCGRSGLSGTASGGWVSQCSAR